MGKLGEWEVEVGETPEVRPEGNGPGGVGSLGKPEEIGEVVVGNWGAWVNWQSGKTGCNVCKVSG